MTAHARPCLFPRCRTPAIEGQYCPRHGTNRNVLRAPRLAYNAWYTDPRWRSASKAFLHAHPRCICPQHRDLPDAPRSTVVDHITPHKGDVSLFWDAANWQALAKPCHDSWKRRIEKRGEVVEVKGSQWFPTDVPRPAIPVTLVCGPPGAGKTTWVRQQAQPNDIVLDLDVIAERTENRFHALMRRNKMVRGLASAQSGEAWVVVCAPLATERIAWRTLLHAHRTVVLTTPLAICLRQMEQRDRADLAFTSTAAAEWWQCYTPLDDDEAITPCIQSASDCIQPQERTA